MEIVCNALIVFVTIDLAIFLYEGIRKIYRRHQIEKAFEEACRNLDKKIEEIKNRREHDGAETISARSGQ